MTKAHNAFYEVRPRKAIDYAKHRSRSHHAVIRVYDEDGSVIDTHEQTGAFKESGVAAESGVV